MTFKSLLNFGGFNFHTKPPWDIPVDRYHGDGHHGHRGSCKKGGSGAALSALTLLAFLFLLNVMQQSLDDNNSTTTTTTTLLLRDTELPVVLDNKEDKNDKTKNDFAYASTYGSRATEKDYVRVQHED